MLASNDRLRGDPISVCPGPGSVGAWVTLSSQASPLRHQYEWADEGDQDQGETHLSALPPVLRSEDEQVTGLDVVGSETCAESGDCVRDPTSLAPGPGLSTGS